MLDLMNPEERPEQIQRYGVYTIRTATEDGVVYSRSFIVVRNGYGVISRFTRLQDYAGFKVYKPISSNAEKKLYYICGMLNYVLVDNGKRFGIRHVFGMPAGRVRRRCPWHNGKPSGSVPQRLYKGYPERSFSSPASRKVSTPHCWGLSARHTSCTGSSFPGGSSTGTTAPCSSTGMGKP